MSNLLGSSNAVWRFKTFWQTIGRHPKHGNLKPLKKLWKNRVFIENTVLEWQPKKDSNPHKQSQSLSCYLYTIRLFVKFCCRFDDSSLTTCLVYNRIPVSSTLFSKFFEKVFSGRICTVFLPWFTVAIRSVHVMVNRVRGRSLHRLRSCCGRTMFAPTG